MRESEKASANTVGGEYEGERESFAMLTELLVSVICYSTLGCCFCLPSSLTAHILIILNSTALCSKDDFSECIQTYQHILLPMDIQEATPLGIFSEDLPYLKWNVSH